MTSFTVEAGGAFSMWARTVHECLQLSIKTAIIRALHLEIVQ